MHINVSTIQCPNMGQFHSSPFIIFPNPQTPSREKNPKLHPKRHSILKLYELVLALGVLWLPYHQAGDAHPFPIPLRSSHRNQT